MSDLNHWLSVFAPAIGLALVGLIALTLYLVAMRPFRRPPLWKPTPKSKPKRHGGADR